MVFPRTVLRLPLPETIRKTIPKIGRAECSRHRSSKIVDKIWSERKKKRQPGPRDGQKGNVEMDPKI